MSVHGRNSVGVEATRRVEVELSVWARIGNLPFVALIRAYRVVLSPFIGGQCRFEPTCSVYALEAYRLWGPVRGTRMTLARIARCHPMSKGGLDPVAIPDKARLKEGDRDGEQTPRGQEA